MNRKSFLTTVLATVIIFTSTALTGCGSGGGGGDNNGGSIGASYYPFTNGSGEHLLWEYRATGGSISTDFDVFYLGTGTFDGQATQRLQTTPLIGTGSTQHIVVSAEGVREVGYVDDTDTESHSNLWLLRFDLAVGQSADFTDTVSGSSAGTRTYRLTRLSDESITTPAGTFTCALFRETTLARTGDLVTNFEVGETETVWFAANAGIVKVVGQTTGESVTSLLQSLGIAA